MRGFVKLAFQDQMGLQWSIKLRDDRNTQTDAELWMRIHKLRDRILKPEAPQPDGKRVDPEPDRERSGGHPAFGDKPWVKPDLGLPGGHGGELAVSGRVSEEVRPVPRVEDHPAGDAVPRVPAVPGSDRKRTPRRTGGLLRKKAQK